MDNVSFVESEMTFRMRAEMDIGESRLFWLLTKLKLEKRA